MNKKILFFDGWTKGIRNFERLCPSFDKNGIEYKLFHLGSWGDKSVPLQESIRGIKCYDISYYQLMIYQKLLRKKNQIYY